MINSIHHFCSEGVKNLEKVMQDYSDDLTKTAEMVRGVTERVTALGVSIIAEEWESYDELLRKKKSLRQEWHIVRRDETTLLTSLGSVTYHKTLFKNKATGEREYLLDRIMGIGKHARLTEDAENKKGDIRKPRKNTVMPKLVYVYEGITNENGRSELVNKKHFGDYTKEGKP